MGRSAALKLAARGANLVVVARNGPRLEELVTELKVSLLFLFLPRYNFPVALEL